MEFRLIYRCKYKQIFQIIHTFTLPESPPECIRDGLDPLSEDGTALEF
jgi:hypothetical protein